MHRECVRVCVCRPEANIGDFPNCSPFILLRRGLSVSGTSVVMLGWLIV